MKWLDSVTDSMDMNLSELWEMMVKDRRAQQAAVRGVTKRWPQSLNNNENKADKFIESDEGKDDCMFNFKEER